MAAETYGTKGEPQFASSGAPAIDVDPTQVAVYAGTVGNHIVGTSTQRTANVVPGPSGKPVWEGCLWDDTTDSITYKYISGSWVSWVTPFTTGTIAAHNTNFNVSTGETRLWKRNGIVWGQLHLFKASSPAANFANAEVVADLPTGFRPQIPWYAPGTIYNVGNITAATVKIGTDGTMTVFTIVGASTELLVPFMFPHA